MQIQQLVRVLVEEYIIINLNIFLVTISQKEVSRSLHSGQMSPGTPLLLDNRTCIDPVTQIGRNGME